ncbi:hypothetical protein PR202_ga02911 [Eleusine coracana subsp. coracana]|uniref:Uncharacterized protein n=1 Tax=Eleusine coracana subsp. coracana TaxID=191504 RepID=A0AAV5BKQ3_ELECO|nr:hypothetical protein PR202_ga02911 [Eleusine coracana subsp. coracana]
MRGNIEQARKIFDMALLSTEAATEELRKKVPILYFWDPSVIALLFALSFEWDKVGSDNRIHSLFERALADDKLQKSVLLWRCYLAYEAEIACNASAARRVFFRAIHACPWSKRLWLDGFQKLSSILTLKELSDLQEVMREKELNIRTDIYEILLQDETDT